MTKEVIIANYILCMIKERKKERKRKGIERENSQH